MISLARTRQAATEGGRYLAQTLRLMVGQPDYERYLQHQALVHPDRPVMSYAEFFRNRQQARYGSSGRCC